MRVSTMIDVADYRSEGPSLLRVVLDGLTRHPKALPPRLLYDRRGSELFDQICELPEYYPTRTEIGILRQHLGEMAAAIGPRALILELGSGSGLKTRMLLDALEEPVAYVPVDISRSHLERSALEIAAQYPSLEVLPVCANFHTDFPLPVPERQASRCVVFFPGSTIGNFEPDKAQELLSWMASTAGPEGGVLIGVDLVKDVGILEAAYDDAQGVTAEFNYNLLDRLCNELGADFDRNRFRFRSRWQADEQAVVSHLVATERHQLTLGEELIQFDTGETIHTESAYKFTVEGFAELARSSGLQQQMVWTDPDRMFSVQLLAVQS